MTQYLSIKPLKEDPFRFLLVNNKTNKSYVVVMTEHTEAYVLINSIKTRRNSPISELEDSYFLVADPIEFSEALTFISEQK